ncbi:DUF421 domain-containing protein [Paenibacillus sp. sptzw28]|uniref:DUF421 domain-containing protein n=1 Tax=Paenibacillus sp. sptzw28 TaxID=715179 RepID=UPI001C6E94F6|nr:DUF421 domain-containing protein [Paenibacillus sp. sptzw28]QYR19491.1 DUF421 domain-containing protein [Paenibacillus sp. sptzw28]
MPDWAEVGLRTLFAVVFLFFLTRLLGKRQVSQLSLFEYITGITIGNLAAYISLDTDASWGLGFMALGVWVTVSLAIEFFQLKTKRGRDLLEGKGTTLIKDGKILEDNLKNERLSTDDLLEQLREKNVFKAADVEFALIEPSGDINVLLKKEHQPLTAAHLGIKVAPEQAPQAIIMDGKIMNEPLAASGFSRQWVLTELEKLGVAVENVFLGQVDSYGQLFVDLFDDQIKVPEPQLRASLLAQLKKCEADLEMFGLSTKDKQAKRMYERCSKELEKSITELKPYLTR